MHGLISSAEGLAPLLPLVAASPWVAIDTEADSLHSYPEKLCLVQISIPGRDELVDPLSSLDLQPLLQVLQPHRLILHGADYDLRLLFRTYGFVPGAVFDTMLAARLLGCRELGLDKLAASLLGVHLEKGPQRANWSKRPLTERMAVYARNDTRHLKLLADRLTDELTKAGRVSWHDEVCGRLVRDSTKEAEVDPDLIWRLGGANRLDRRGLAVLKELWHWRDQEALRRGRPPFFVLAHEILLRLADAASRGQRLDDLIPVHLPPLRRQAVLDAVARAMAKPEAQCPKPIRSTGIRLGATQRGRYLRLQELRDRQAAALGIDPSLIASRSMLVGLAANELEAESALMAWQRALMAPALAELPAERSRPAPRRRTGTAS